MYLGRMKGMRTIEDDQFYIDQVEEARTENAFVRAENVELKKDNLRLSKENQALADSGSDEFSLSNLVEDANNR